MKQKLILGTALLTISGLICRLIGFFYRVFLSHTIGAEGLGIYQLIVPVYHLSYAICAAGIQTALSRLVASAAAKKEHTKALLTFLTAMVLSFALSLIISVLIQSNSAYLAEYILEDTRCAPLLKLVAYSLPFGALHGCVMGWFMGKKQIHIPAIMQVLEEIIRLVSTWLCYLYLINSGQTPSAIIAVVGLLFAEVVSVLFSVFVFSHHKTSDITFPNFRFYYDCAKELLTDSFPLTLNRIALNLLHSVEAILIPLSLQKCAMTRTEALETLGIVSGMALPLVLFPTAIINALSSVLLPTVSENQALENKNNIQRLIKKTTFYALVIGVVCTLFFSLFGKQMGLLFYSSSEAGHYITILASICPFLFVDIVLASVMNGLGKTFLCFSVNFANMCLRVSCIYFFVPNMGIYGYLAGLIGGEIFCMFVSLLVIYALVFKKQSIDK